MIEEKQVYHHHWFEQREGACTSQMLQFLFRLFGSTVDCNASTQIVHPNSPLLPPYSSCQNDSQNIKKVCDIHFV